MEEVVNRSADFVSHTRNRAECVCTGSKVSDAAQEFHRGSLLLKWIRLWIRIAENFDGLRFDFRRLTFAGRFNNVADDFNAASDADLQNLALIVRQRRLSQNLHAFHARTIIQFDE